MLGVQVKRSALPIHFASSAWTRMEAEAKRLGWFWIVAAADPAGSVYFLDPSRARQREGRNLGPSAIIENLLLWIDDASSRPARTRRRRPPSGAG